MLKTSSFWSGKVWRWRKATSDVAFHLPKTLQTPTTSCSTSPLPSWPEEDHAKRGVRSCQTLVAFAFRSAFSPNLHGGRALRHSWRPRPSAGPGRSKLDAWGESLQPAAFRDRRGSMLGNRTVMQLVLGNEQLFLRLVPNATTVCECKHACWAVQDARTAGCRV